jgi:membrane-associated protease RseP (regulator of RpoE activity)
VLVEPTRTAYDLQFSLLGIPVRVHPMFWLVSVLLGSRGLENSPQPMGELLMWVAVVFVSILVHEMGHAIAIRGYGWRPWVTLYAFGGLASYEKGYTASYSSYRRKGNTPTGQIIISLAGPVAGFLLAGVVIAALYLAGRRMLFPILGWPVMFGRGEWLYEVNVWVVLLVQQLLWVNIYWGLVNLLPVYPLDGGQVSRELFMSFSPRDGYQQSLLVSIFAGGALAVYGAYQKDLWLAILFGVLAYQSYQLLQQHRGGWGGSSW